MNNYGVNTVNFGPTKYRIFSALRSNLLPFFVATLILLSTIPIGISVKSALNTNDNQVLNGKLIKSATPKKAVKPLGGSSSSNNTPKTVLSSQSNAGSYNVPGCSSVDKPIATSPNLNTDHSGLIVGQSTTAHYQVYGNTNTEIYNQMNSCSPVLIDGQRYAASTDYSISWLYESTTSENGLCSIKNVQVGITNVFIFPNWQKSNSSSSLITDDWNNFIANLTTHEYGHAEINQRYAQNILNDIQNLPATDCSTINIVANNKANAELDLLNQANVNYDAATNHGETQGAIL